MSAYDLVSAPVPGEGTPVQFLGLSNLDLDEGEPGEILAALAELWFVARYLAGDDEERIRAARAEYRQPTTDLGREIKERLDRAECNDWWTGLYEPTDSPSSTS